MASQLGIFNEALILMGERTIASLSEPREPQRVLTSYWADVLQYVLEQGMWNFAMTATVLTGSASTTFGNLGFSFTKPSDLIHTLSVSLNSAIDPQLVDDFVDAGANYYAPATPLYVRYTSNDPTNFGGNLAKWSQTFAQYAAAVLADFTALRLTASPMIVQRMAAIAADRFIRAHEIDSVADLPGLKPFNARARQLQVVMEEPRPPAGTPFTAALSFSASQQQQPSR